MINISQCYRVLISHVVKVVITVIRVHFNFISCQFEYRIYSINRPGRLLNFWTLRVGAYSRWAFIRGWALIKFSPFSVSVVVYFTTKQ